MFAEECKDHGILLYYPPPALCTDNAAMVGCAAFYKYIAGEKGCLNLDAYANLEL
jgi:N6-L-threonylcarbamoyladenine synthase